MASPVTTSPDHPRARPAPRFGGPAVRTRGETQIRAPAASRPGSRRPGHPMHEGSVALGISGAAPTLAMTREPDAATRVTYVSTTAMLAGPITSPPLRNVAAVALGATWSQRGRRARGPGRRPRGPGRASPRGVRGGEVLGQAPRSGVQSATHWWRRVHRARTKGELQLPMTRSPGKVRPGSVGPWPKCRPLGRVLLLIATNRPLAGRARGPPPARGRHTSPRTTEGRGVAVRR